MPNARYVKGANAERDIRTRLQDRNIACYRSPGSKGRDLFIGHVFWAQARIGKKVPKFLYKLRKPVELGEWYIGPLEMLWTKTKFDRNYIGKMPRAIGLEMLTHDAYIGRRDNERWMVVIWKNKYHEFLEKNPIMD